MYMRYHMFKRNSLTNLLAGGPGSSTTAVEDRRFSQESESSSHPPFSLQPSARTSIDAAMYSLSPPPSSFNTGKISGMQSLEDLIPVVNRLQDVFSSIGHEHLDLPQIVVVGSQSSGKSSVLENIVGRDFLPRGTDVVTRRPLILQLVQTPNAEQEHAQFLHLPGKNLTDFAQVRQEIERETNRVAGEHKGISRTPINLRIYSPKVLDLTLVDLPGITKIPVGDQPPDIEMRIRQMVMEFISKPNSIILAVSPANQDIVNSDALKIAREVDPEGKRTVGVLTKLDLMDAGTNAADILAGKTFPLRLGFIGVINRSQQDILDNKPIDKALESEEKFFKTQHAYRTLANKCGTRYLTRMLNSLLMHHIRERLPELKARLNLLIVQTEQELLSYGDATFSGKAHQGSLLLQLLTKFATNFNSSIDGTYSEVSLTELSGGARLYYIFNSVFGQTLESIDPCAGLSVQDIRTAIRNSTGPRPSLFIPEMAFDLLIKPQIRKLELPGLRCVELVFDELLKIVNSCDTKEMLRFPKLHQKVLEVCVELLRERMAPTQAYIESLISIQLAYVNTNHPDFIGGSSAISMLERKHERRRRELDRFKRHHLSTALPNGPAVAAPPTTRASTAKEREDMVVPGLQHMSHHAGMHAPHGRDGGFLTYFFGGHPGSQSPEPVVSGSRSNSPSRHLERISLTDETPLDDNTTIDANGTISGPAVANGTQHIGQNQQVAHPADREDIEVELIRSLIHSYFNIIRKTIADLVPKTIMHLIVNYAKENVQSRLVTTLYKEELFNELLQEDERVMNERQKCKVLLETYRKGAEVLQDIF